jgi:putative endonuclease
MIFISACRNLTPGFTRKYNINGLVHFKKTSDISAAIERGKEIRAWRREKKGALVETENPDLVV